MAIERPLRIALLGYRSHPYCGGQGVYLRFLSKALVEAGHSVDVISGPPLSATRSASQAGQAAQP